MTDAERQAFEAAVLADPSLQSALRTLRAWKCANGIGDVLIQIMGAVVTEYAKLLLDSGMTREQVNDVLPAYVRQLEAQRQEFLGEVRRAFAPDAPQKLQ